MTRDLPHAPYTTLRTQCPPAWIDVNQHMNATHYTLVVYDAHVALTDILGLGDDYVAQTGCGKVVLESHLVYEREVGLNDELEVRSWLLAVDTKRLHFFHELYNLSRDCRAAIAEQVDMHVDLGARRSAPFPGWKLSQLQDVVRQMLAVPYPEGVGSRLRPPVNDWLQSTQS